MRKSNIPITPLPDFFQLIFINKHPLGGILVHLLQISSNKFSFFPSSGYFYDVLCWAFYDFDEFLKFYIA